MLRKLFFIFVHSDKKCYLCRPKRNEYHATIFHRHPHCLLHFFHYRLMPPFGDQDGVLYRHEVLVDFFGDRLDQYFHRVADRECYHLFDPRRTGSLIIVGYRRVVRPEETSGERMVSNESQAQVRV